mgnify:CR=1 FL=1
MAGIDLNNYEAFLLDYLEGNLSETVLSELKAFVLAHPELSIDLDADLPKLQKEDTDADFKKNLKRDIVFLEDEEILSYLENKWPEEQKVSFEQKLANDPELTKSLEQYKKTFLPIEFNTDRLNKSFLYKSDEEFAINNRALAYFENQLTIDEKPDFENELKTNLLLAKEYESYTKTLLKPDLSVINPDKEALKKEARVVALFSLRTIASIAAAILLLFGFAIVFNYYSSSKTKEIKLAEKKPVIIKVNPTTPSLSIKQLANKKNSSNPINKTVSNNLIFPIWKQKLKSNVSVIIDSIPLNNSILEPNYVKSNSTRKDTLASSNPLVLESAEKVNLGILRSDTSLLTNAINTNHNSSNASFIVSEEDFDDDEVSPATNTKESFWKKAVALVKRANKLGIKSLEGEERTDNSFLLSFNALTVEKK